MSLACLLGLWSREVPAPSGVSFINHAWLPWAVTEPSWRGLEGQPCPPCSFALGYCSRLPESGLTSPPQEARPNGLLSQLPSILFTLCVALPTLQPGTATAFFLDMLGRGTSLSVGPPHPLMLLFCNLLFSSSEWGVCIQDG